MEGKVVGSCGETNLRKKNRKEKKRKKERKEEKRIFINKRERKFERRIHNLFSDLSFSNFFVLC